MYIDDFNWKGFIDCPGEGQHIPCEAASSESPCLHEVQGNGL